MSYNSWSPHRANNLVKLGQLHAEDGQGWCMMPAFKTYNTIAGPRTPEKGDFVILFGDKRECQYLVLESEVFRILPDGPAEWVSFN